MDFKDTIRDLLEEHPPSKVIEAVADELTAFAGTSAGDDTVVASQIGVVVATLHSAAEQASALPTIPPNEG